MRIINRANLKKSAVAIALSTALVACGGGGGGGGGGGTTTVDVTGTVSAPNGAIAFNQPSLMNRMFASIFGANANAAFSGVVNVGAGVTVQLIEVNAAGVQIGNVLAEATTETGGTFTISAPAGFTPGPQYVVRATGTAETIDARVTDLTVNVDPVTDAASDLITSTATDLTLLSTTEIDEIVEQVDQLSTDIDPTGLNAVELSTAIQAEAAENEETTNVINSTVTTGQICGTVIDSVGTALENIVIVARDFGNWVTRAKTKTAADGTYCLNVPKQGDTNPDTGGPFTGEYILGALNRTGDLFDPRRSASEYWTATGGGYNQFDAGKVSVPDTTTVTKDFQLADGARIYGTVYVNGTTTPVEGALVIVRDYRAYTPVATARVKPDGTYRVNVINGDYFVEVQNRTLLPYASEVYDGGTGSNIRNVAPRVSVNVGDARNINFDLESGYKLTGIVSDGVGGTPVPGVRVMIDVNGVGASVRHRTNKQGKYRIWLKPDIYAVASYGQNTVVDMTAADAVASFTSAAINRITAVVQDASANPVSQVKIYTWSDLTPTRINLEITASDGSIELYTPDTGNHYFTALVDDITPYASGVYNGQIEEQNATPFNVVVGTNDVGTVSLPNAGWLTGTVTSDGVNGVANFRVQLRSTGGAGTNKFITTRTRGDGTYYMSLPPGNYFRVKMLDAAAGAAAGNCDTVVVTAAQTTTVDYNDGTDTCTITP